VEPLALLLLAFLVGLLAIVGGQLALIVIGFRVNPDLGCLLAMGQVIPVLGPVVSLLFLFKNPKLAGIPFGIVVVGHLIALFALMQMAAVRP
jgi:hypothetical protein